MARAIEPFVVAAAPTSGAADKTNGAAPSVIAEFSSYSGLHAALRKVREHRNVSLEQMDRISGAPERYFSKVLAPNSERRLTMQALEWALNGLGVRCLIVDDPDMLKQINGRMVARDNKVVRSGAITFTVSRRFFSRIGKKGAAKRNALRIARKAAARKAAMARWHGRANTGGQ